MYEFRLPDIGEGISEAQLTEWLVETGDTVEEGDDVASVNTDKVEVELPAPRSGTIAELCWQPGDTIPVGAVVLRIEEATVMEPAATTTPESAKAAPPRAGAKRVTRPAQADADVVAAPSTRKLAADLGVDLRSLPGSGKDGRILRTDVEKAAQATGPVVQAAADAEIAAPAYIREPLAGPRRAAADRMAYSVHTLATSTMSFEARGDGFLALLDRLRPAAEARKVRLSPAALFAKCVASALLRNPRFNAHIDEEKRELLLFERVNLGIAVASDQGLLVPVVRGVDRLSLFDTARAIAEAADKARTNRLAVDDVRAGTFTLSNTGNLEEATILSTRPVVNPPQSAILWVSRIVERPRNENGAIGIGPMLSASLSFDHRFIDGADATRFINDLVARIECPETSIAGD